MSLHILCLWDVPSEDLDTFRTPLIATLGSVLGVKIFFAHLQDGDWHKLYEAQTINSFIFLSPYAVSMECLPRNFSGPVCILDLSLLYNGGSSKASLYSSDESLYGMIGERKKLHDIYRFTPPFSLGSLLNTLSKSLLSFPHARISPCILLQEGQNIIFDRPQRRIYHPKAGDIFLTEKEVAILDLLIEKAPQKLTKKVILEKVWGYLPHTSLNTHTLETHIYHLRQKFEEHGLDSMILSDHEGYAFNSIQNNPAE